MTMRGRAIRLLLLRGAWPLGALLLGACLLQPSDDEQIRALVRREAVAISRGDIAAAYHLTDLDFRAVCPRDRYAATIAAAWPPAGGHAVASVTAISVRGSSAEASVTMDAPTGSTVERRRFVREGGRWYVYGNAEACGSSVD